MSRHRKVQSSLEQDEASFLEDLETSLLNSQDIYGIDAFESIFNKKKLINQMIEKQKKIKQQAYLSYIKAKQRVTQIEQLQGKVDKQTTLLQTQIEKITDAHNMGKLLMMQKILKLQKETQQLQRKRNQCYLIKLQQQRSSLAHTNRSLSKKERQRIRGLSQTLAMRSQLEDSQFNTLESNRRKAESVRTDQQRRKERMRRIQEYKKERAQKNYLQKVTNLQKTIEQKQTYLIKLSDRKELQQKRLEATQNVSQNYINSFFATATIE